MKHHNPNFEQAPETLEELHARLLAIANNAAITLDISECRRVVAFASEFPTESVVPALNALMQRRPGYRRNRRWRKRPFVEIRLSAIKVLQIIGSPASAKVLADVLLFDVPSVRNQSSAALAAIGDTSVPILVEQLKTRKEWQLQGMQQTIRTLGLIGETSEYSVGGAIIEVLLGLVPKTPARWLTRTVEYSAFLGALFGLGTAVLMIDGVSKDFTLAAVTNLLLSAFAVFLGSGVVLGGIIHKGLIEPDKNRERDSLNESASNALIALKDPKTIPDLIKVTVGRYPSSAKHGALRALLELLPLIGPNNTIVLDGPTESQLTNLFAYHYYPYHNGEIVLTVVRALEYVGTGLSAAPLERMIRRMAVRGEAKYAEVLREAELVLSILQERKRHEEAPAHLLRPSDSPPTTASELLRAAPPVVAVSEQADQLLRATNREPSS